MIGYHHSLEFISLILSTKFSEKKIFEMGGASTKVSHLRK